jgi:hypothetical protein
MKEIELERERLINENLDLKLHIQYLEELVSDQASLRDLSITQDPMNDKKNGKLSSMERELQETKKELESYRSALEISQKELSKVRSEIKSIAETEIAHEQKHLSKSDTSSDSVDHASLNHSKRTEGLRGAPPESAEEKLLRVELDLSRDFANTEACSLIGFHQLQEAESRIAELEKSLEEARAQAASHSKRSSSPHIPSSAPANAPTKSSPILPQSIPHLSRPFHPPFFDSSARPAAIPAAEECHPPVVCRPARVRGPHSR